MGHVQDKIITAIQSWKEDENGHIQQVYSEEYGVIGVKGVHEPGMSMFGQGGDSGAAITTGAGKFVGLYFGGNDYTGTG